MKLNSYLKRKSSILVAAIALTSIFFLNGCSKLNETVANENIQLPTHASRNLKNLFSYLEVVELINSTKSYDGLKRSNFDSLERIINCKLTIIDSLTTDGDGYQYKVNFANKAEKLNPKDKNYDNQYRFGSFDVELNFNYREINAISTVKIDSSQHCYIANGAGEFTQIIGNFKFVRNITNKINISLGNTVLIYQNTFPMYLNGDFLVSWTEGEGTDGIFNDVMVYNGSGTGSFLLETFKWNTSLPLEKNQEYGCAVNIVKGVLQLESLSTNKIYRVDFDPFNNKSCDSIIKIYILGKEYEITL